MIKKSTIKYLVVMLLFIAPGRLAAQLSIFYDFNTDSEVYTELTGGTVLDSATANSGAASIDNKVFNLPSGTIPWNFTFDNAIYTGLNVSSNGFITFGATPPSSNGSATGYTPISAATAYNGAVSAFARDLNAIFITGTNAYAQTGVLRYKITGNAPSRKFVIQFKNFRPLGSTAVYTQYINFQIRLCETSNKIEIVYGPNLFPSTNLVQVGLRGSSSLDFFNRKVTNTNNWSTSIQGTNDTSTCRYSSTLSPASGTIFRYSPSLCPRPQNLGTNDVTQTSAQLTWTTAYGGGTYTVEYGSQGFVPGTGTTLANIANNYVNISGLTALTFYDFYVKQNCGANGNSVTTGPYTFSSGGLGEDCATAQLITVAASEAACNSTIVTSGVSANGPNAQCSDVNGNIPNDDFWLKFVAPSDGSKLVIKTSLPTGASNDWVMQVWRGCPGTGTVLACADDGLNNDYMPVISLCQDQYIPGETLYIRAWTYSTTLTGSMSLCVYKTTECPIAPANDECIAAISVPVTPPGSCPGVLTYSTKYATKSGDAASCQGVSNMYDVWFKFNTGSFGDLQVTFTRLAALNLKAQLKFACGEFEIACWNPADGPHLLTGLNPNADYVLRVWSDSLQWGTFNICIEDICSDPSATMGSIQTACKGDSVYIPVTFTGTPPWTFVFSDGAANTGFTTSTSPYFFKVAPQVSTTYTPVSVHDLACNGTVSGSTVINILNKPVITSFTPVSGPIGTAVTIKGTNLSNVMTVRFNATQATTMTIANDSTINTTVPSGATTGPVYATNLSCTVTSPGIFTVGTIANFTITLKMFLQAMYNVNSTMYYGKGLNVSPSISDSVTLSLASTSAGHAIVAAKTAALNTSGIATFQFPAALMNNSYYLVIKHRNSLQTWSKNPVLINTNAISFDLSAPGP